MARAESSGTFSKSKVVVRLVGEDHPVGARLQIAELRLQQQAGGRCAGILGRIQKHESETERNARQAKHAAQLPAADNADAWPLLGG